MSSITDRLKLLKTNFTAHQMATSETLHYERESICVATDIIGNCLTNRGTLFIAGNGGSASDAQHMAAEFTGRYLRERKAQAAIALTTDTSALTAIGNDYGFENIFSRQLEGLAKPHDVFLGISTSGKSPNILRAVETAKDMGLKTLGLTGEDGGEYLKRMTDIVIHARSHDTPRIQEMHILIIHSIVDAVDQFYLVK